MAKKRSKSAGADVDWYLISIDRLKQVGLVVVILLLGTAGYWFWQKEKGNPAATPNRRLLTRGRRSTPSLRRRTSASTAPSSTVPSGSSTRRIRCSAARNS